MNKLSYNVVLGLQESFAETKIRKLLESYNVVFEQEVQFDGCINPITGASLRYDFYLPVQNCIIEYDSIEFHDNADVKCRDRIKTRFAFENGIRLLRVQGIYNINKIADKLKLANTETNESPIGSSLPHRTKTKPLKSDYRNGKKINRGNKFK